MTNNIEPNITLTPSKNKNKSSVTINLNGDLSLNKVEDLKASLIPVLDKYQTFSINVQNVENIDLGLIQLLQSFLLTASRQGKMVMFHFDLQDDYYNLFQNAGLSGFMNSNI